jgi:HD-GYP domain-containing protein (c-di-GMP phosphodiesterase class II)
MADPPSRPTADSAPPLAWPLDPGPGPRAITPSEVISSLSYALDLTEGQTAGHTLRTCAIGMRFAQELDLPEPQRAALFHALLLKDAGCSANSALVTQRFGSDDHIVKRDMKTTDWTTLREGARYAWRNAARGGSLLRRVRHFVRIARGEGGGARELIRLRCERGADISRRLGFTEDTADAIRALDEHWDGGGPPAGLAGDAIPLLARIAGIAQTLEVFHSEHGLDAAMRMVADRRGSWFDPVLCGIALGWKADAGWWLSLGGSDIEERINDAERSSESRIVDDNGLDLIAEAFAEIIDAKSPYTYHHSSGVARFARGIAREMELGAAEERRLYRAGLLHDIGKLGVSNRILDKAGPLTSGERRAVELHAHYSWDILRRVTPFRDFAWTAALHHERLDGTGYPWGFDGPALDLPARVLAVADVYEALTATRPYRAGIPRDRVLDILRRDSGAGLDGRVVGALESSTAETRASGALEQGSAAADALRDLH